MVNLERLSVASRLFGGYLLRLAASKFRMVSPEVLSFSVSVILSVIN
jgi:hypothetical protein